MVYIRFNIFFLQIAVIENEKLMNFLKTKTTYSKWQHKFNQQYLKSLPQHLQQQQPYFHQQHQQQQQQQQHDNNKNNGKRIIIVNTNTISYYPKKSSSNSVDGYRQTRQNYQRQPSTVTKRHLQESSEGKQQLQKYKEESSSPSSLFEIQSVHSLAQQTANRETPVISPPLYNENKVGDVAKVIDILTNKAVEGLNKQPDVHNNVEREYKSNENIHETNTPSHETNSFKCAENADLHNLLKHMIGQHQSPSVIQLQKPPINISQLEPSDESYKNRMQVGDQLGQKASESNHQTDLSTSIQPKFPISLDQLPLLRSGHQETNELSIESYYSTRI